MTIRISSAVICGRVKAPPSKSSMQRACAAALLHRGTTHIHNPGSGNDDLAALSIITQLGATVRTKPGTIVITSEGYPGLAELPERTLDCGESGLSARLFASVAALSAAEITLTGEGSLLTRPMNFFEKIFPLLNVNVVSNNNCMPLRIKGPIQPVPLTIDGSLSSQFLTGLLFTFGNAAEIPTTITVKNLKSKPYIDLTLDVMKHFGYRITREGYAAFTVHPVIRESIPEAIHYRVEGDWSGASFLLVAGAIAGEVKVSGLDPKSSQPDKSIIELLKASGAGIEIVEDSITISKKPLQAFHFDATDCPDLFPPLVTLAAYCSGTTVIKGTSRLRAKESDRAKTLQDVFGKMGISVVLKDDEMHIVGGAVHGTTVSSGNDHRIAMAAAVAALSCTGEMIITQAAAVNKSYPDFYTDLSKLGAAPTIIEP